MNGIVALTYIFSSKKILFPKLVWFNILITELIIKYTDLYSTNFYNSKDIFVSFVYFLILQEIIFYYIHYILHLYFYRKIHIVHHIGKNEPCYAWYSHPLEHIFLNISSCAIPIYLLEPLWNYKYCIFILLTVSSVRSHHKKSSHIKYHHNLLKSNYGNWFILDLLNDTYCKC